MPKYLDETGLAHFWGNVKTKNVRAFDTVADMQAATDLMAGMTCHTNGFHTSGDGGAAYYTVSASGTANGMDVLALQGGLVAHLVVTEPYVTPEQFGAYGDGTHDDTAAVLAALGKSGFISMQAHTYYIGGTLALTSISNKRIQGAQGGTTLLFNDSTIGTSGDNVWLFAMISCSEICFNGVTFDYVPSQSSSTDKTVVDIDGCDKIVFTNCNFYSDKNNSSFTNICTCVWVRKSDTTTTYNGEVSFDGCEFVNHSGAPSGGCLWVVTHVDSVTLNNCTVSHCALDEAIGVWSTDGGTVSITNSRAELVKLGVTPSQLIGAYIGGIIKVSNSSLLSGTDLGALSFIRAHKSGKIFISDCYVKCDPCNGHMVFKIEDGGGEIQISNSRIETVTVNYTGDNQRIFECQHSNAVFKVTDSTFVIGKGKTPSTLSPFTFLSASKGRLQFIGCTFVLENPENFANMLWYFSGATYWQAVANSFIGTAGNVNLAGPTYLTDTSSAANQRGSAITFNQGGQTAFA